MALLAAAGAAHAQQISGSALPVAEPAHLAAVPAAGSLRVIGRYPVDTLRQAAIARLPDGKVLVYGISPDAGWRDAQGQPVWSLRRRSRTVSFPYAPEPLLWNPQRHGWSKLSLPPECHGAAYLHTLTALPDNKLLIAGGLCDQSKDGADDTSQAPYARLSLWNGTTGEWEHAPSLEQPRIYHTATLLDDGSVLLIGGESDPALSPEREPVLASVERYRDDQIESFPAMHVARARHTATALRDGSVLVAGGIDEHGAAIASVELWDASTRAWRELPPLAHARYAHTATLLDDGRVMIAGGNDEAGHPLDAVELWDPPHAQWSAGTPLLRPLQGQAAVRLANGNVLVTGGLSAMEAGAIDWALLWDKATETWRPAGRTKPNSFFDVGYIPTLIAMPDGSALVFTQRQILQWRPATADAATAMETLDSKPALVALANGKVMAIARTEGQTWSAQVWNPGNDSWASAGKLAYHDGRDTKAIQLRSGRVLHLGLGGQNDLWCEIGGEDSERWESCGHIPLEKVSDSPIGLGLLPDGRVVLVANAQEAFVFDERTRQWTAAPMQWNDHDLTYGAPIRTEHPLARLLDTERNNWIDISVAAASYWENVGPRVDMTLQFSNGQQKAISSRPNPPSLLWDPVRQRWAYVLMYQKMGANAQLLPDGCALSWPLLTLFDARTAKVTTLPDPGIGVSSPEGAMVALADGTVAVAGAPDGGVGSGFFHRKASCAGFATAPEDALQMPGIFSDRLPPTPAQTPAAPVKPTPPPSRTAALVARVKDNPWPWLALLGTLLLYLLLRYAVLPLVRYVSRRTIPQKARDTLTRDLPSPFAWGTRIVIYGLLALFCVVTVKPFLHFRHQRVEEECNASASACVDAQTGLLQSEPRLEAAPDHPKPRIPCRYVGVWSSRNGNLMFRLTLKDDGTYVEEPNEAGFGNPTGYRGYWMVQGDNMVWRDKARPQLGADINPLFPESDTRFTLVEGNGSRTHFELIQATPSSRCTP
ncbi:Kelch repeat-containing protein [Dyella koreensis]|uniref:Galactose oxidase n=1 Tax=Dyella koreensis TaxID=311235 RepID=A0ABW8K269_9GAMM